ncbi:MAG: serine/threonine protein kinase [Elusimicrobiaceae bacterium]|nr:serine/threonine protein kinase [Elusimicrobiaceae bacterium]
MKIKSVLLLLAAFLCFVANISFAQSAPFFIEGKYAQSAPVSGVSERQKADLLENTITEIEIAYDSQNYDKVISLADDLIKEDCKDYRLYLYQALAYEQLEDCKNAEYFATKTITAAPSAVDAYVVRANCSFKNKKISLATRDIEKALMLNPKSEKAQKAQKDIYADPVKSQQKNTNNKDKFPKWFTKYLISIAVIFIILLYLRYKNPEYVDSQGRRLKEYNIKEQYKFIRLIGEGGMGKVYEAYDNALKRKVAIKRIRPELLKNGTFREQFLSEARTVAMLRHPSVVEIYTVIETTTSLYLVFEYVDGQTLETRLDIDNYIPFKEIKEIFKSVCAGLSYAHSLDIVHCDLKPGNIMIADFGPAKVMDFGVAQKIVKDKKNKEPLSVAGTPAYMSPEQQRGYTSKQSDIFSLGVCLYEALIGVVPWGVKGYDLDKQKIVKPSAINPRFPKELDDLLERALAKNPDERIQSVDEFWEILSACELKNK